MKARIGFVSNSSSASFILTLNNIEKDNFVEDMFNEFSFDRLDKDRVLRGLEEELEEFKRRAEEYTEKLKCIEKDNSMEAIWKSQCDGRIKNLEDLIKKIPDLTNERFLMEVLMHNGISFTEKINRLEFSNWTTMWNNIDDAGEFMKTLIAFMVSRYGSNSIETEVDSD